MSARASLEQAASLVHAAMPPTPQYAWPLLAARAGCEAWVKHENHTPTGAFKVRGGLVYCSRLDPSVRGLVSATRGNHGQSLALAGRLHGVPVTIVVPQGNSREKNAAMRAFGADLREHGEDFDTAREAAMRAAAEGLFPVPPFHSELVRGVATYGLEFLRAAPPLHTVYVPIGWGSGICGVIAARDALGLSTEVVGVVAADAPGAKLSFEAGRIVETNSARTFADGMAVRVPVPAALDIYGRGAARIVAVGEEEVAVAVRLLFSATHNGAEGAGAAALAALLQEREAMKGRRVGVVLSGGNIDTDWFRTILSGGIPTV